ncbi:hypothetical protein HJC23_004412 [Cyclotella cryptica]|uniref:DNA topoisomerase 1 n=1 Tax=Cyclotella cryptica TaxID=29204 RepID=A0ABD3QFU3_9STRA|eukprot:CCRYP_006008-RA/>CCRYP_006008-RA protein AED:0.01 eAED:0.01 QI:99/1/1/1/1/1/3/2335/772
MADSSSEDDNVPLGQITKRPDSVVSSSSLPNKEKRRKIVNYNQFDDDDDDSAPIARPKKKKIKTEKKSNGSSSKTPDKVVSKPIKKENGIKKSSHKAAAVTKTEGAKKPLKEMDKAERIAHAMQAYLWWNASDPPKGCQWVKMEHAGVSFPEPYTPHGIKMRYDGVEVDLSPLEEEAATFFAAMDPEGMHLGNPKTAPIFIKNFFADFRAVLGKNHVIKDFKKCDFEPIREYLNQQKLIKKAITDEERKQNKDSRNEIMFKFGYSLVDDHLEKVGNYNMEPPGAFRGRGEHPKMGKLKQRVEPEQVMINLSECAPVPKCNVPGHAWGDLRHDPTVQWLCQWKENINNQVKYMQLAAQSSFKGKSDRSKYNKAAKLCGNIDKIRANYKKNLKSKSLETRQIATAMWVIDRLALRVGGEKDTDEEADTVGCCSLRVEHLKFDPNNEGSDNKEIELEFLGKDSMLFKQTIDFGSALYTENNGMGEQVYENFKLFCKKKKKGDDVFSDLTPTILNAHLKGIMEGLTAKVFRTYNASKTLQEELLKTEKSAGWSRLTAAEKVVEYNNANREVAILCNHQRSVSKAQETQLENLGGKLQTLIDQKKVLKKILKRLTEGNDKNIPTKKDEAKAIEKATKALEKAKKMKETAKTPEEKIAATEADEKAKILKKEAAELKFNQAHLWDKTPTSEQVMKRITAWSEKISKMEMNIKHKDDNKEVSLGTSKLNYMDPRISVAWCKRNEVPIEKIFSKTMRDKFNWSMAVPPDWQFNEEISKQG